MVKLSNFQIMKNKPDKFYFLPIKLDYNSHVTIDIKLAIVQLLANSLSKVDIELRNTLYNEIVLSGGNTMFEGLP
jgi:actin-related protein